MKNAITRNLTLASRIREIFLNGSWIAGTNYKEQLLMVDLQAATMKVDSLNTIAALTWHVNYYLEGVLNALDSGKLEIKDKFSFDLPPINSNEDWSKLVSELLNNAEKLAVKVEVMEESLFDRPFVDERYGTLARNMEGIIEHGYYHLGQITLIRKLLLKKQT